MGLRVTVLCVFVGRHDKWLVVDIRCEGTADSVQDTSLSRHQREVFDKTDPKTYGVHDPVLCSQTWWVHFTFVTSQTQGNTSLMCLLCMSLAVVIDVEGLQEQAVSQKMMDWWCVQEQAMKLDISVLKQVEALEKRVISAHLQVKVWALTQHSIIYHAHCISCL